MDTLHGKVSDSARRTTYGISRPEANGVIEYKAGLEESFEGEGKSLNCGTMIVKKGMYFSIVIKDYVQRVESISETFDKITSQPGIDPQGYCVEVYANDTDVTCMVRMENL